jgi:pyruvate formate lyase activating enzyme
MYDTGTEIGLILDIQRMSSEDGPGLRTTVFFKGCNLKCAWCHNPESISFSKNLLWIENRCISCDSCGKVCQNGALVAGRAGIDINRVRCKACLACVEACPAGALEAKGAAWKADRLVEEVLKDRVYFEKSGGGITVSGGEALLQAAFVCRFLEKLQDRAIHTALDTAGNVSFDVLISALWHTDLVLYDLKLIDAARHRLYTGNDNSLILDNAARLASLMRKDSGNKELWIRTPVIPGATADEENIAAIGNFITAELGSVVAKWELCTFNNLCRDKYQRLGEEWRFRDTPLILRHEMERLLGVAAASGVPVETVCWSGRTRLEEN